MFQEIHTTTDKTGTRKRKAYTAFTAEQRAAIGKFASENGNAAAVEKFKDNFEGGKLRESTVHLFKKRYVKELKKAKRSETPSGLEVTKIASRKRGCPLTLGEVDTKVQAYIKALRKASTPVNINIIWAAAEGIVIAIDRTLLKKHGGSIELKQSWAQSLMQQMKLVKQQGSTHSETNLSDTRIASYRKSYLLQIKKEWWMHTKYHLSLWSSRCQASVSRQTGHWNEKEQVELKLLALMTNAK